MLISSLSIILIISTFKFISSSPAIKDRNRFITNDWAFNGLIPYTIDLSSVTGDNLRYINEAIQQINDKTAVVLYWRTTELTYLEIVNKDGRCYAPEIGVTPNKANIVQIDVENCAIQPEQRTAMALKAILSALGLGPTQNREDRDKYVAINFDKMDQSSIDKYKIADVNEYDDCLSYDYLSVMHDNRFKDYDPKQAESGCNTATNPDLCPVTITAKDPEYQKKIGFATELSKKDIQCINGLYSRCRVAFYSEDNFEGTKYGPFGNTDSAQTEFWKRYQESDLEALGLYGKGINSMEIEVEPYTHCYISLSEFGKTGWVHANNWANPQRKTFKFARGELTNSIGFAGDKLVALGVYEEIPCVVFINGGMLLGSGHYNQNSLRSIAELHDTSIGLIDRIDIAFWNEEYQAKCSVYMDGCTISETGTKNTALSEGHDERYRSYSRQELIDRGCKVDGPSYFQLESRWTSYRTL